MDKPTYLQNKKVTTYNKRNLITFEKTHKKWTTCLTQIESEVGLINHHRFITQ